MLKSNVHILHFKVTYADVILSFLLRNRYTLHIYWGFHNDWTSETDK